MILNIQNIQEQSVQFTEHVSAAFFDDSLKEYYPNRYKVIAKLDKFGNDLKLEIILSGVARYRCDSCLSEYNKDISFSLKQIFQIGPGKLSGSEDIIELDSNATQIDLTPFIKEMIVLNHPYKMKCKENCKGLCPGCGVNLNLDECKCDDTPVDPRWAELRKLIK